MLPGVALLVLSTSSRHARLHDELHHVAAHGGGWSSGVIDLLVRRGRLFRDALVALYLAAGLLAVSGLAGSLGRSETVVAALSGLGVAALVVGCSLLVDETRLSFHVIEREAEELRLAADASRPRPS